MARHKAAPKENHERWLVSYADLVTLLFAFFVVMFASTQTDHTRAKQISEGVEKALEAGATPPKIAAILGGTVDDKGRGNAMLKGPSLPPPPEKDKKEDAPPLKDLNAAAALLRQRLQKEIQNGSVEIRVEERGVIIGLNSAVFFSTGADMIDPSVYPALKEVASILNRLPNLLRFEGHTDSVPINTTRFPSNWELSASRSIAMLRFFNEKYEVARERMAIVGYADTVAISSNETEQGRQRNRRVDIVIVSELGLRTEARPNH
jgi:chemotaxis protein MotB